MFKGVLLRLTVGEFASSNGQWILLVATAVVLHTVAAAFVGSRHRRPFAG